MAKRSFSNKYAGGSKPSENRKQTVTAAIVQQEESKTQEKNKVTLTKLDEIKAQLKEEANAIENQYTPFKSHRNMPVQETMAQLVGYASTEFGLNQKQLIAIGLHRFFMDLKEDSTFLKMYL